MGTAKSCPICRELTHFVVPSNIWVSDNELKQKIVEQYKINLEYFVLIKEILIANGLILVKRNVNSVHHVFIDMYTKMARIIR